MDDTKFNAIQFDEEELEILDAYNSGKIETEPVSERLLMAAKETQRKTKNINIRINENDLSSIKMLAAREGMPYQTLIGSLIHKYANGRLKDVA
jgi:predicted DNA binding CopG/RHH family protein